MPTTIAGQNGAVIEQDTKIAVTGCGGVKSYKVSKAELLAKALKACKRDKKKSKRLACEKAARKKYETKNASKKHASKTSKKQAKKK
jgi:D-arabinose 1-dehydrogenase-like Zn-dependent alcohol dehydrogenase